MSAVLDMTGSFIFKKISVRYPSMKMIVCLPVICQEKKWCTMKKNWILSSQLKQSHKCFSSNQPPISISRSVYACCTDYYLFVTQNVKKTVSKSETKNK